MSHRTCILCKHFRFIDGSPGYSEYTPGSDAYISCYKDKFHENLNHIDSLKEYRDILLNAEWCKHYDEIDVPPVANGNFQIPT